VSLVGKKAMLYVVTDLSDVRWLQYILDEFSRINLALFPIQICDIHQQREMGGDVVYYVKEIMPGVCIPNRAHVQPNGKTEELSHEMFVLEGTADEDARYACKYDLFWNAFVFLSRLEEYRSEIRGKKIRSYSFNHPRREKSTFEIPVVNHLFNELERLIRNNFQALPFGQKEKPVIEYSHDVDYIQKMPQLRLKQTCFNVFNTIKSVKRPFQFAKGVKRTASFLFSNPSYWCFDYWEELEKRANVRSVFYVYAKAGKKNLKSWLLDPSYDIAKNIDLQNTLKGLIQEGFEIGLHGSFYSATDRERLSKERIVLEESIGIEVDKVRQHWLRYEEGITPYLHNEFFKYDSTLGWNDHMGFRSGIASRYRPYDHKNRQAFDYMVTPQVVMDANIYDYGANGAEELEKKAVRMLQILRQVKSTHISVSWHQRVCSTDYNWQILYEKILN